MGLEPAIWEFRCQECGKWFDKKSRIPFTGEHDTGEYELLYCQPNYYGDGDLCCKTTNYFCSDSITDIRPTKEQDTHSFLDIMVFHINMKTLDGAKTTPKCIV